MTTADTNTTDTNTTAVLEQLPNAIQPETALQSTAQQSPSDHNASTQYPSVHNPSVHNPSVHNPSAHTAGQPNGTFSITSFVLGVVSIVAGWSFVAPIIGLVLGIIALRRKSAERTLALWGVWLNGAMLAISTLLAFGLIAVMLAGLFSSVI